MNVVRKPSLRVLHVEDNSDDAMLVERALERHFNVQVVRVETSTEMEHALGTGQFDLVLCDFNLPQFSAESALTLTHQNDTNTPCIVISGSITEDQAVRLMESGARDYLQKESLQRLVPAIRREMRDARIRRERVESDRTAAEAQAAALAAEKRAAVADDLARANKELIETQAQLVQSAKMASLGGLVAGVAHEINNPLGYSVSHLGTVRKLAMELSDELADLRGDKHCPRTKKLNDRLKAIELGLKRVQSLVEKLRNFASRDDRKAKDFDLRSGIESSLMMLGHRIERSVNVELDFCHDNRIQCSPGAINQVILNLLSNAIEAMGGSGTLQISTRRSKHHLTLRVQDSGPGIPRDIREKIFEPFFTTKAVGAGMGLGLSISYNIVVDHNGSGLC